jgi:hypothetical protein
MKSEEIKFSSIPEFQFFSTQSISYTVNANVGESKILYTFKKSINVKKCFSTVLDARLDEWVNKI